MKLHKQAHTVYKTQYHIVWVTRFRRKILVGGIGSYLRIKLEEVRKFYPDWHYVEIGIDRDHIHLHMIIPPKYAVSMAVETMKKNTSRALRDKFSRFLGKIYFGMEAESGPRGSLCPRLGSTRKLSDATFRCRERKTPDKRSLNFKSTTAVKPWVSILFKALSVRIKMNGRPSPQNRKHFRGGALVGPFL